MWNEFDSSGPIGKGWGWAIFGLLLSIWHWNLWYLVASVAIPMAIYGVIGWIEKMYWKSMCDNEEIRRP